MSQKAYANIAAQIVDLRIRVGQSDSIELFSDAEATSCLNAARDEFNRMAPILELKSFLTVANQQFYTPTEAGIPADSIGLLKKVFWKGGSNCSTSLFPAVFGDGYGWVLNDLISGNYTKLHVDMVALDIIAREWTVLQKYFGGSGKQKRDNNIWLDPIPTASNIRVYYYAKMPKFATSDLVTKDVNEVFMCWAEHRGDLLMAKKQSEMAKVRAGFGKSVDTAAGAVYLANAKDAEKRFYAGIQKIPKMYRI